MGEFVLVWLHHVCNQDVALQHKKRRQSLMHGLLDTYFLHFFATLPQLSFLGVCWPDLLVLHTMAEEEGNLRLLVVRAAIFLHVASGLGHLMLLHVVGHRHRFECLIG